MKNVIILARKEIQEGLRNRWVLATTLLLAALALTLTFLGSAPTGNVGAGALDVVIVSLSSLTIFLVPLIALLISHDAIVGEMERGTMLLLLSSYTFGLAMLRQDANAAPRMMRWLAATFVLGALFVAMEVYEFAHLLHQGAGPGVSAYLSAFFTLVGTHGLHVTAGLCWLAVMIHQVRRFGLDDIVRRRLACLSLFWHFLDLVWICVFTFVYLREFA